MSTCISREGEFSEHELAAEDDDLLTCQRCFAFAEDAARERLRAARRLVNDWQANGNAGALGDPPADVWHWAARQLLAVLDGEVTR